jgi:hypothetical protein
MEVKVDFKKILEELSDSVFVIEPNNHAVYLDLAKLINDKEHAS